MPSKRDILDLATKAVGDRGLNYGAPEDNFARIVNLWNAHLINRGVISATGYGINPVDVAMMCALLKIARLEHQPDHLDSWVDLAGYAACGGEIAVRDKQPVPDPMAPVVNRQHPVPQPPKA